MSNAVPISLRQEVVLFPDRGFKPQSIERAADGGFLVILDSYPSMLVKLDHSGKTLWTFERKIEDQTNVRFSMVSSGKDGGIILCATRKGGAMKREDLPGLVMKLDSSGKSIGQLDAMIDAPHEGPFYRVSACAHWGDGYALIADERRPEGVADDYGKMSSWPYRNVLIRLRSDLSVAWRKPLALHVLPPSLAGPKETASGNLVVPGETAFILGPHGSVKAPPRGFLNMTNLSTY